MYDIFKAVQFCKTQPKLVAPGVKMDLPPLCVGYAVQHLLKIDRPEWGSWATPSEVIPFHDSYFAQARAADYVYQTQTIDYANLEARVLARMMQPRYPLPATGLPRGLPAGQLSAIFGRERSEAKVMSFASTYGASFNRSILYNTLELNGIGAKISHAVAEQIVKIVPEVVDFTLPSSLFSYRPFSNETLTRPVRGPTYWERLTLQDVV